MPRRAYAACDESLPARCVCSFTGDGGHATVEVDHVEPVAELEAASAEGVGGQDVGPCTHIVGMDATKDLGTIKAERLGAYPGGQATGLQHGSEATIEKKSAPCAQGLTEIWHDVYS